jgi:hypothetical protein
VPAAALLLVACKDFDPANRRAALQSEYELRDQTCEVVGYGSEDGFSGTAVATGTLISHADEPQGFAVTVRFLDGDVDVGRPQIVNHTELIEPGDSWDWEASVELDERPTDLRCNVIQVAIGDDVDL